MTEEAKAIIKAVDNQTVRLNGLSVVTVIESDSEGILGLRAFEDTPEGNKAADRLFEALVREHSKIGEGESSNRVPNEPEIQAMLDDGIFRFECGFTVAIVHSN